MQRSKLIKQIVVTQLSKLITSDSKDSFYRTFVFETKEDRTHWVEENDTAATSSLSLLGRELNGPTRLNSTIKYWKSWNM